MLSFWTFLVSQVLIIASFFVQLGSAAAGWTTYAPLSTNVGTPGSGQTLVVAAIFVTGVATIMGGINYVTTVIRLRAPGMTYMRMPLTVWGLWLTAILNVLFVPVLGSAALLLFARPRLRHAVLHRRVIGGRAAAAIRFSSSTSSGSSATQRSTSSSCRPGASSATSSRSSRASRPIGTGARSAR